MNRQKNLRVGSAQTNNLLFCEHVANLAVNALIEEVSLTPKPGLVDRDNNGSHKDLNYALMIKSAQALKHCFFKIACAAFKQKPTILLRKQLSAIGISGEQDMLNATNGINTHKGAIWIIGLLIAGASMNDSVSITDIIKSAGCLANIPVDIQIHNKTNGEKAVEIYGIKGAKGQAMYGFPHIMNVGLPTFKNALQQGFEKEQAQQRALLSIMSALDDTCVLHRGGIEGLKFVQMQSQTLLKKDFLTTLDLQDFDKELIARNISCGGAADLLAATIFLYTLEEEFNKWKF